MTRGAATLAYFDRTFVEGMDLLMKARDYLAESDREEASERRPVLRLVASCETVRLTARLTQVMAWLLMQKAVCAGEMSLEQAQRPENRLGGGDVCAEPGSWNIVLPRRLQELLDQSLSLYTRVARLDSMVQERVQSAAPLDEPVAAESA